MRFTVYWSYSVDDNIYRITQHLTGRQVAYYKKNYYVYRVVRER